MLDTVNLSFWLIVYGGVAVVMKLMIDELTPTYEYPILQVTTGFVLPILLFIAGLMGNLLMLASHPAGRQLSLIRLALSSLCAVASIPILGYESQLSFAENIGGLIFICVACVGCIAYYRYYYSIVRQW